MKPLTEKQLEELAENWADSDDGLDFSDDDDVSDPTYVLDFDVINAALEDDDDERPEEEEQPISSQPTAGRKQPKKNITWKAKHLELNEEQLRFRGKTALPDELLKLETPYQFFSYLLTDELIELIAKETNLYSVQTDANKPADVSCLEIRQFIGIVYYMSVVHMPNVKKYWSEKIGFAPIMETMSSKRFEKLRNLLHFNDNTQMLDRNHPDYDRLFKIRPVIQSLNNSFSRIPLEQYLSCDEQMCSTKARSILKQYMPDKPSKWGYKLFVLSGVSGFCYKFEVYSGQENKVQADEPDLGASANVVVRLARNIPSNECYRIFFDNYYSSLPLIEYLAKRGVLSLGTIRRNRISHCKLTNEKELKKKPRGFSEEQVGDLNGTDISVVAWKDNKVVTLASNFAGKLPVSSVRRYDKSSKAFIEIERPFVIAEYNKYMGGVDLLDCLMGHYKIKLRSKRWYMRMFYHFLDLIMCNAWLLYRRIRKELGKTDRTLDSADFRVEIAETLCKFGTKQRALKRKSELESQLQVKKRKGPMQHVPPKDVRKDQCGHWPEWAGKRIRCKLPNCKGFTQTICFKKFHTE